jgi:predicted secreted protein
MGYRTAGVPPAMHIRGPRSHLIATLVALCISMPAFAQDVEQPATVLHLSQTAERPVVRDLLRIELRVDATGADAVTVQSEINRRMASELDRARQVPGVKVETGFYNVGEERPQNGPPRWRGGQSVILTGKDAASMLKLAGQLQSDGLSTSSLGYETSPETVRGAEEDLTAEALTELGHRAATIADQMHLTVLRYRELRIGNAETGSRPVPRFAAMAAATPVAEPGEAVIRVTVEGDILLVRGSSP